MGARLQIAGGGDGEIETSVARQHVEHVIEEADAGFPLAGAVAVQPEADVDVGLAGLAIDLGDPGHHRPLSRMRASIERA